MHDDIGVDVLQQGVRLMLHCDADCPADTRGFAEVASCLGRMRVYGAHDLNVRVVERCADDLRADRPDPEMDRPNSLLLHVCLTLRGFGV